MLYLQLYILYVSFGTLTSSVYTMPDPHETICRSAPVIPFNGGGTVGGRRGRLIFALILYVRVCTVTVPDTK